MITVFIDIETLPEPSSLQEFIELAKENVKVPPSLTKPKLIDALSLGADAKLKTVDELKEIWVDRFGKEQAEVQGEAEWRKTSFNGAKGQICVISFAFDDSEIFNLSTKCDTEKDMLIKFWDLMRNNIGDRLFNFVVHNAKFDLPFLFQRSVVNNVKPMRYKPHGRHGQHYYDTMEAWAGFNGRISMDDLSKALGIQGKGDMDGSMVYDTWQNDKDKVIEYCDDDVRMLREIYKRLEFIS